MIPTRVAVEDIMEYNAQLTVILVNARILTDGPPSALINVDLDNELVY